VQLLIEKGISYAMAARQLGITDARTRNWTLQVVVADMALPG
jgi:transposase-like protein